MSGEIVLPLGTEYVATAEVPGLIALALHPDASRSPLTVKYYTRDLRPTGEGDDLARRAGPPIGEAELEDLARVGVALPPEGAIQFEVQKCLAEFQAKGGSLDWSLGVVWTNPKLLADMARLEAEREHSRLIVAAIRDGSLNVKDPISRAPTNELHPASEIEIQGFCAYVAQFGVRVAWSDEQAVLYGNIEEDLRQLRERRAASRYRLGEAADEIAKNSGADAKAMRKKLCRAAYAGDLPVYHAGRPDRHTYPPNPSRAQLLSDPNWFPGHREGVHACSEEAYADDLNAWLAKNEPRISWRFPLPEAQAGDTTAHPLAQYAGGFTWVDLEYDDRLREALGLGTKEETPCAAPLESTPEVRRIQGLPSRRSELTAEIEAARATATDPDDYHAVWTALREMALAGTPPFTGEVEGTRLGYTNSKGEVVYVTKDALRKRMNPSAR